MPWERPMGRCARKGLVWLGAMTCQKKRMRMAASRERRWGRGRRGQGEAAGEGGEGGECRERRRGR